MNEIGQRGLLLLKSGLAIAEAVSIRAAVSSGAAALHRVATPQPTGTLHEAAA